MERLQQTLLAQELHLARADQSAAAVEIARLQAMVIDLKRLLAAKVSGNPIGTQTELSVEESQQVQARDITEVEEDSTREHSLQQSRECERCSECDAHMAVVQKLQAEKEAMEELIAAQVQHCDDSMN